MNTTAGDLALVFPGDEDSLVGAREAVRNHLQQLGVDESAAYAVDLALEELAGNAIRHGYDATTRGSIRVGISVNSQSVLVSIADDAPPFDPTRHPEPDPPGSLQDAPVGGRGIAMVRRVVRAMRYRRESDGNRLEVEISRTAS